MMCFRMPSKEQFLTCLITKDLFLMPASKSDFEEITLAIGLLGGVIAILLYIGNFFNNNVIPNDADFQQIALSLVSILLIEIPMILLFFLLKCIIILTITFTFGFIK
ncbi:hypothetical protein METP2_02809 [Methanosarcinales archaeon]|nr:hypothetical protein METP2_02809 [Methanosarcinales archaeon]